MEVVVAYILDGAVYWQVTVVYIIGFEVKYQREEGGPRAQQGRGPQAPQEGSAPRRLVHKLTYTVSFG